VKTVLPFRLAPLLLTLYIGLGLQLGDEHEWTAPDEGYHHR